MPETALHWVVLIAGVSLGQFVFGIIAAWLAGLSIPGAAQFGSAMHAVLSK